MRVHVIPAIAAAGIVLAACSPARAAGSSVDQLKAEIDGFVAQLGPSTQGGLTWDGSDPYQVQEKDGQAVAVITHARLTIHGKEVGHLVFDRIEVRQSGVGGDAKLTKLAFVFPQQVVVTAANGMQTKVSLNDAHAEAVLEIASGHIRDAAASWAGARIDQAKTGEWISFGPLSASSKIVAGANGGWTGPVAFELKKVAFLFPKDGAGGSIDRIAYTGESAGPSYANVEKLRDQLDALRKDDKQSPELRVAALLHLLPEMPTLFSELQGKMEINGLAVRDPKGEPLVSLAKISIGGKLNGLSGETTKFRIRLRQEGLEIAPALVPAGDVPHRVVIDVGLENISSKALRAVIEAAAKMGAGANDAQKQEASMQMMGAAAQLDPTFRVYDAALDTRDVGVDVTAEAKGSPLLPSGYSAAGDVLVRGFDDIAHLAGGAPFISYLPLLREMAVDAAAPDGSKRLKFHLASTPQKLVTINGNDVMPWFVDAASAPGKPRILKPAEPPMHGPDVVAVQHALASAGIAVKADGAYRAETAVAVARFQKKSGLGVNGVVDAATRQKLGLKD